MPVPLPGRMDPVPGLAAWPEMSRSGVGEYAWIFFHARALASRAKRACNVGALPS